MPIQQDSAHAPVRTPVVSKLPQSAEPPVQGTIANLPPFIVSQPGPGRSYAARFQAGLARMWEDIKACFSPAARGLANEAARRPESGMSKAPAGAAGQMPAGPAASQREAVARLYAALEQPADEGRNLACVVEGLRLAVGGPHGAQLALSHTLDVAIEKAMERYRDFHLPDADSFTASNLFYLRQYPDQAEKALSTLPPALRAKAQALLATITWNMGYGNAEALSFQLLAKKVQTSLTCVTADNALSTGDNPYVEQALRSTCGFAYNAPELELSGLTLDTPDVRLVDLVENLSWRYQQGRFPASHESEVTRAAMTGFKAMTPRELDKLELVTRLRCSQQKFAVKPGVCFLTNEQGQPLSFFMRGALRGCYEERIGVALASCAHALRQQGFPHAYADNMQAARSMMEAAAAKVLGSAGHYAHTLDAPAPLDKDAASALLLRAGLARQTAPDAELIMTLLQDSSLMSRSVAG